MKETRSLKSIDRISEASLVDIITVFGSLLPGKDMGNTTFSTGMHARVRPRLYKDDDPIVVQLIGQLVAQIGRRPLLVVDVREIQCTCGLDDHSADCMTRTARHSQHIQVEGMRGPLKERFSHLSGLLFEPVSGTPWTNSHNALAA